MSHRQLSKIRERVGMVFQSFNLWPHLTVQQNVSEALLHVKGMKRDEAKAIAMQQLEKVGMAHKADVADYPLRRAEAAGGDCPFAGDVAGSDSV
jgi:polar amino acid transport system ATP-binding protein